MATPKSILSCTALFIVSDAIQSIYSLPDKTVVYINLLTGILTCGALEPLTMCTPNLSGDWLTHFNRKKNLCGELCPCTSRICL